MRPRLQINLFRPTAAQSIVETIRDAINLPLRAARCGFRHQAVPARVARAMHVEKRDAISLTKWLTVDVEQRATNFAQASDRYVSRHKRIRNSREPPLLQIEVSSANLR